MNTHHRHSLNMSEPFLCNINHVPVFAPERHAWTRSFSVRSLPEDRTCKLWDVNNGQCMETLRGHTDEAGRRRRRRARGSRFDPEGWSERTVSLFVSGSDGLMGLGMFPSLHI